MSLRRPVSLLTLVSLPAGLLVLIPTTLAAADTSTATLPFSQDWSDPSAITVDDDWSDVPGVIGYRGNGLVSGTNVDPRTVLADGAATAVDVFAQSTPTRSDGGVHELQAAGSVALQGSGSANAPHLVVRVNTSGVEQVEVSYTLRDLDADNGGAQQVALQYRVGGSGNYTNVPDAYVPDASGTLGDTFKVSTVLPAEADDQTVLDLRILTTDTSGTDSMTGVDDIVVAAAGGSQPDPEPSGEPSIEPSIEPSVEPTDPGPVEVTLISELQGDGPASPLDGQGVAVEAVVTSLFTSGDALDGFFVQEEDADADDSGQTSEGVFVFCRDACPDVAPGDLVRVEGTVDEFFGMTQIATNAGDSTETLSTDNPLPAPVTADLPSDGSTRAPATYEAVEGMVVEIPGTLAVSEYFQHSRFGLLVLTVEERPYQFTHVSEPSVAGNDAYLADLATRRIILDDDNNDNNDAISNGPDEAYPYPSDGLSLDNRFRGGDTIDDLTGVMHWSFSGASGTDAWRIRPLADVDYTFESVNLAPAAPEPVGGDLTVASFNVLNYFTDIDTGDSICGPGGGAECRGADSAAELDRQQAKIVAALAEMDADVVGLIEIQNDDSSVETLVAALNAEMGEGTYAAVSTGTIGTDAIKVAFIYQPGSVSPAGDFAVLDSTVDPAFVDTANRPALVQTFEEVGTGERFTAAVNHLKSKGSACTGDPDVGDGQGNCNGTRTDAAQALANYLATDPTGSGDTDFLIVGDLNAYRNEDPITSLETAGYTDLLEHFGGDEYYGYVFDGQLGYLDHALASASLQTQVTGAGGWLINADEDPLFDYNDDVRDGSEAPFQRKSTARPLYAPDAFRSSDHDPVLVGLDLAGGVDAGDGGLRLTLLHNNDGESSLLPAAPRGGVARFATIVDRLRAESAAEVVLGGGASGSLLVSSGDNYLAGPQLQASLQNYDGDTDYSDDGPFYDARALDLIGYDASAVGNHEFDFGPGVLGYFISEFEQSDIRFVSANLDVTGEAALEQFVATSPGEPGTLVEWTRTEVEGRSVAIVGATTPRLDSITSPGPDVEVSDEVSAAVQGAIDEAAADGTDIVVLIAHLQNIAEDQALIETLSGLDVAVAGGGDELLANPDDLLLPGAGTPFGPYPLLQDAADGTQVPIVTTQGSYGYVGRLIVDLDADGEVVGIDDRSGPVRNVFDPTAPPADQVDPDPVLLAQVEQPVADYVEDIQGEVIATTEPRLDGVTAQVRTRETNLGSLFADALRTTAEESAAEFGADNPTVALTNSGGIRNSVVLGPDEDITTFDTFQIAPFSNFVAYTTDVAPEKLKELLEHAVSAGTLADGSLQAEGRFAQVAGLELVYDPSRAAQVVDRADDGTVTVTAAGERVRQVTLTLNDDDPANDVVLVRNGVVLPDAPDVDLASNSFTITNGDNFPFNLEPGQFTNTPVSYQQSLADYLTDLGTVTAAQYPEGGLGRIVVDGEDVPEPEPEPEPENTAPVADAGGPYEVRVGRSIRLDATGSLDADDDELTYRWDYDSDGRFDDATGAEPQYFARGRQPGTYEVSVQVSDGTVASTDTTTVSWTTPGRGPVASVLAALTAVVRALAGLFGSLFR